MRACCALLALLIAVSAPAAAWPVLSEGRETAAGWCYPDHEERQVWWLPPETATLKDDGGRPDVHLTIFSYLGVRETGDLGTARAGAVLQFTLEFPSAGARLAEAQRWLGPQAKIRPLVPEQIDAEVVFAGVNSVRPATLAEDDETGPGAWTERRFAMRLTPEETAVVADAWEHGSVILSVNLAASATVLAARPARGADPEPDLGAVLTDSVPIAIDSNADPDAVTVLELDATMPAAYTSLELGCAELGASGGPSDLARVIAVVEAEAMNGDLIDQEVRFSDGSPPTEVAKFDRAVRLDHGYRLRVARVYATGVVEEQPARRVEVWQGFVDICSVAAGTDAGLDPRLLY
ncbi:MAG TPA: hypothetical protein PKJ99_13710 [Thermoanaerobaculales bacterium]|nr:hypothetical protein [Thermoanaerobaculales bacterium]HPA81810.1 hypothetical protein [Thermoanaerobaculales bacterium]HQL31375.1 hypothetical protein [Thermoanaerobaculales bacterium]HQN95024.1 hypothetical protein [Thermoanaerobaculales bacterium]HQP44172.1 hypothetical protein [Thermoanaerobaculales bacterium]